MSPSNSQVEALTLNVIEIGDVAFRRNLGLDEVMKVMLHDRISVLIRREKLEPFLSQPYENTVKRWPFVNRKRALIRNKIFLNLDLGRPRLQNCEHTKTVGMILFMVTFVYF